MKIGTVRLLQKEEQPELPTWTKILSDKRREQYILKKKPFIIREEGDLLLGILSSSCEGGFSHEWRQKAEEMLEEMKNLGASVAVGPYEGEFPEKVLPFAKGRVITPLFAFAGAKEALRRQGKNPEEALFVVAGGTKENLETVFAGMGGEINQLAFFTDEPKRLEELRESIYAEEGLLSDVFSSVRNPLFSQGDVVLCCGMEQTGYEHILKRGSIFLEVGGNRPALRRVMERRWDVTAAEGFFFSLEEQQMEGRQAEAVAFIKEELFRRYWLAGCPVEEAKEALCGLLEGGFSLSGFSAFGKRVKIPKNQG